MNMRDTISLVESQILLEAAGTHGFYNPSTDTEILTGDGYQKEHADYVLEAPERFGISQSEIEASMEDVDDGDVNSTPHMRMMARLLLLVMSKGWVRVNYYRGAWAFHALTLKASRAALQHYLDEEWIEEATLDWGPDVAHPFGLNLYPHDEVVTYAKTGRHKGKIVTEAILEGSYTKSFETALQPLISDVIRTVAAQYVDAGTSVEEINAGSCEDFAHEVLERWQGTVFDGQVECLETDDFYAYDSASRAPGWDWKAMKERFGITAPTGVPEGVLNLLVGYANHVWIFDAGKHYDAEAPDGVASFFLLPFFERSIRLAVQELNGRLSEGQTKTASSEPDYDSLDAIKAWARSIGVKLEANEHVSSSGRYAGDISIVWIERSKKAPKGTGKRVMDALIRYADSVRATISLQADDEVGLPEYYAGFGFKIVKSDSGDDVRPTGPDMLRLPRTRKARRLLGSARPFTETEAKPVGVAVMYSYGNENPYYYMVFDVDEIEETKDQLQSHLYDANDLWVGYVIQTIEWTEMLPIAGAGESMVIPTMLPDSKDEKQLRSNKRWQDLFKLGKKVFEVRP